MDATNAINVSHLRMIIGTRTIVWDVQCVGNLVGHICAEVVEGTTILMDNFKKLNQIKLHRMNLNEQISFEISRWKNTSM